MALRCSRHVLRGGILPSRRVRWFGLVTSLLLAGYRGVAGKSSGILGTVPEDLPVWSPGPGLLLRGWSWPAPGLPGLPGLRPPDLLTAWRAGRRVGLKRPRSGQSGELLRAPAISWAAILA